jgi:hypothetical protein
VCLLGKTLILTENNQYKQVEDLTEDDKIVAAFTNNIISIKRIIKNIVDLQTTVKDNYPLLIRKNSVSKNLPLDDIFISGHHRIILQIDNNHTIGVQACKIFDSFLSQEEIESHKNKDGYLYYYHIELEDNTEHLISSGIAIESFQNT